MAKNQVDLTAGIIPRAQEALPGALRRAVSSSGMRVIDGKPRKNLSSIASVDADSPDTIEVNDPARFAQSEPQTLAHEATHLALNNRAPGIKVLPQNNPHDPYDFGGEGRLARLRQQNIKLYNLPQEEAASIVQYYQSQGGEKAPAHIQQAYGPWVKDLNSMPMSTIMPTQPGQAGINTEPRAPLADPSTYNETQTFDPGETPDGDIDLSSGFIPIDAGDNVPGSGIPTHPLGMVTGIDHDSGLPIVKRNAPHQEAVSTKAVKAAEKTASEPELKPKMAEASSTEQPIGGTDPESGRQVTQPTDNPAKAQALATDAMPAYKAGLKAAIKGIGGAELAADRPAKDPKRLAEKVNEEGQPPETVSDYGAAQITVDSLQARDAVIASVKKRFPNVIREDDNFDKGDPEYGYRNYSMQVQMPNRASMELQIVPKEVFEVNAAEHKDYKDARDAENNGDDANALKAGAKAKNDAAMDKFNARNTQIAKGSTVTLADGTSGIVSYLDPQMKIARMRTDDGRNLTVRQSQLTLGKQVPSVKVLVKEHFRARPGK